MPALTRMLYGDPGQVCRETTRCRHTLYQDCDEGTVATGVSTAARDGSATRFGIAREGRQVVQILHPAEALGGLDLHLGN